MGTGAVVLQPNFYTSTDGNYLMEICERHLFPYLPGQLLLMALCAKDAMGSKQCAQADSICARLAHSDSLSYRRRIEQGKSTPRLTHAMPAGTHL